MLKCLAPISTRPNTAQQSNVETSAFSLCSNNRIGFLYKICLCVLRKVSGTKSEANYRQSHTLHHSQNPPTVTPSPFKCCGRQSLQRDSYPFILSPLCCCSMVRTPRRQQSQHGRSKPRNSDPQRQQSRHGHPSLTSIVIWENGSCFVTSPREAVPPTKLQSKPQT